MSQLLGVSPFSDDILNLNQAQMDWIIRMYDKHNPGKLKFQNSEVSKVLVGLKKWADVLEGKALREWLQKRVPIYKRDDVRGTAE